MERRALEGRATVSVREEGDSDENNARENSIIVSSNVRAMVGAAASTSSSSSSEADTQPVTDKGCSPLAALESSFGMNSNDSMDDLLNNGQMADMLDRTESKFSSATPCAARVGGGDGKDMAGESIPLDNIKKYRIPKLLKSPAADADGSPSLPSAKKKEGGKKKSSSKAAFKISRNFELSSPEAGLDQDDGEREEKEEDPGPCSALSISTLSKTSMPGYGKGKKRRSGDTSRLDEEDDPGDKAKVPKPSSPLKAKSPKASGLSLGALLKKSKAEKPQREAVSKRLEDDGEADFYGFGDDDVKGVSPRKIRLDSAVRAEERRGRMGRKKMFFFGSSEEKEEEVKDAQSSSIPAKRTNSGKASSAFDVDEMLSSEFETFKSDAKAMSADKNTTRLFLDKQRKMIKKLGNPTSSSPGSKTPKKRTKKLQKGQRTLFSMWPPESGGGGKSPTSKMLDGDDSDEEDEVLVKRDTTQKGRRSLLITADQIMDTQSLSKQCESIDEYVLRLQRMKEEEEERDREEKVEEEERRRREDKERIFQKKNWEFKERLDKELDERKTRRLLKRNMEYLQSMWDGGNPDCSRYRAYRSGGRARSALLYTMITHPFTDEHIEWAMDELKKRFMSTESEYFKHHDFVWTVILPEALIKIYMDFTGIGCREEAEERISKTPLSGKDFEG